MAQPYVGEIRIFAGNFAPQGWAFCDGSLLPISQNEVLFQLIGTTYGGDGQNTFALPDLRGRVPIHMGKSSFGTTRMLGETGGSETVTLTQAQITGHTHTILAASTGTTTNPGGNIPAGSAALLQYSSTPSAPGTMNAGTVAASGGGPGGTAQPHENMMPFTTVNFIISLFGIFPSQ